MPRRARILTQQQPTMPIRVCQLITELGPAGAERCVFELSRRLDRRAFEVHVVALRGGEVAGWLARHDVAVHIAGLRGKWDAWRLARAWAMVRATRPDVVHTHLFHADLAGRIGAWMTGRVPLVHTVHIDERRFRPWQFAFQRLAAARCDRVVCVSESVRRAHARRAGLPQSAYEVIPNGIDVEAYARNDTARGVLREQWGVPAEAVLVAMVGRLDYQKGVSTFLDALAHLAGRGVIVEAVIAGDGPRRPLVESYLRTGEGGRRCRHLGFVRDVPSVLSAADVLAMPSRWEGFGLAAAEAMAAGLPVVGTDVSGLRDVIVDGQTGVLVAPDDAPGLAGALERLARDAGLRERMGQAGRRRATERFHIRDNVRRHENLYLELVAKRQCFR